MYNCICGDSILNNIEHCIQTHLFSSQHKINLLNNKLFNYLQNDEITDIINNSKICDICFVNNVNIKFKCNHDICKICYESLLNHKIFNCPFCRKNIFNLNYIFIGDIILLEREKFISSYQVISIDNTYNYVILYNCYNKTYYYYYKLSLFYYNIYKINTSWIDYNIFMEYIKNLYFTYELLEKDNIYSSSINLQEICDDNNITNFNELNSLLYKNFNIIIKNNNSIYCNNDKSLNIYFINNLQDDYIEISNIKNKDHFLFLPFEDFIEMFNVCDIYYSRTYNQFIYVNIYIILLNIIYSYKNNLNHIWIKNYNDNI
jgi:hypothetical protein